MLDEPLVLAGRSFRSRLIVGTSDYASPSLMRRCLEVSGAELAVTVVRRIELGREGESVLDLVDRERFALLPATADCRSAEEAVRTAYLAREAGLGDLVDVEVLGDERTLAPDTQGVLEATKTLVREGFTVLSSTSDDPVMARRLEEAGAAALLVPGAPHGSGLGIRNAHALRILLESVSVPVIVGAGIGTASDAAIAMELGCHGVAVGGALPRASDPERMAEAMKRAVEAGRLAHGAGRVSRKLHASAWGSFEGLP